MSLKKDFDVILTDQEFRELIGEALYHRQVLSHNTKLAVDCVKKEQDGRWRVICKRPATEKESSDGGA